MAPSSFCPGVVGIAAPRRGDGEGGRLRNPTLPHRATNRRPILGGIHKGMIDQNSRNLQNHIAG